MTAGQLQQFICATNWMRDSLIDYARVIQPLQHKLDLELSGKRKTKRVASGISLSLNASDFGWAAIVAQVGEWDKTSSIVDQRHELLICRGGTFSGAQLQWSVIKKEAFPIVLACDDLDYMLLRPEGFKIFSDHRNLIHLFAPSQEVKKHVRGKLLRWAVKLMEHRYTIAHIEGQSNVWTDMVSRWGGQRTPDVAHFKRVTRLQARASRTALLRPLDKDNFVWPTLEELEKVQRTHSAVVPPGLQVEDDGLYRAQGKQWVPADASRFIQRLFVIAHCGAHGHSGEAVMVAHLHRIFAIQDMTKKARNFMKTCLLCHHVKGGRIIPRPWSELYRSDVRNGAIHWDFLYLGKGFGSSKYPLVMKDNFTHYCELIPCDSPTGTVAAESMLAWHSRYGVPPVWISDNGSHSRTKSWWNYQRD